ncbi:hypothetical protein RHABOEDO_001545 [Candidatus Rhabdochlamydia oedothoracis]|uniref:Uncharacterized protein n=1 Tax=Candidatus Rhabdochlamydia oedothoracis TaxID=2720720 RepID=A0ABX8V1Y6_9BACT|nr:MULTISPECIES: hypothetical protein [Rhabdochlamydia]KAG6559827.1 hypothetical protein RHOW815_000171 [Candidatus Rhabdochlamydia sp. W815]MCL6756397.1 hypothetical protein [Candidatus Rhabdochlamydia oedothoracis]QYF49245.1 hypothetical protein RHABOEDO_001545 [Candidatus Rhabdochlamydia oedothoracis]
MGISNISNNYPDNLGSPLQESGSLIGRVITKVYITTNYLISSIGSVTQSILSNFIYVGSLGRYTLDDLKGCFSIKGSLENSDNSSKTHEDLAQSKLNKHGSLGNDVPNKDLEEAKSKLKRCKSNVSVNSSILRKFRSPDASNPLYQELYEKVAETLTLSTHSKTPEKRLKAMEKSVNEQG